MLERFSLKETIWPIEWAEDVGVYIFGKEIISTAPGRVKVEGYGEKIMLSSYSYLGLLGHPDIESAAKCAIDDYSTGSHGVRLLAGTQPIHRKLEKKLSDFKSTEDCITFSSGYSTNISIIASLVGSGDYVIGDKLNHASIVDGCILSGATFLRYNHNDADHLELRLSRIPKGKNVLVISDAVFSMDGTVMNLPEISTVCKMYGALLMVDEAHSLGVLGDTGRGIEEHFGVGNDLVDVKMGTLSKTIPSNGGYVCSSRDVINYIKHQGRGFIYSASLSPACAAAALAAIEVIEKEPERVSKLQSNADSMRKLLNGKGIDTLDSITPVIPAMCNSDERAWFLAKRCMENGVFVQGIPYPVVPKNRARLRCIVTTEHCKEDIAIAAGTIGEAFINVP